MEVESLPSLELKKSSYFISPQSLFVEKFLGKGAFGKVFKCRHENHGFVAVKIFDLSGSSDAIRRTMIDAQKEVEMMLYLQNSPQIVSLQGVTAANHCILGIVMEYLPRGSLFDMFNTQKIDIPWPLTLRIVQEAAAGLSYLHEARFDKRVTHNDLKPENILLDDNFHAKLCDFGGSNVALHSSGKLSTSQGTYSDVYTINYVAPEYFSGDGLRRTKAMDVFSFGMILYFVLTKKPPYHEYDSQTVISFIKNKQAPNLNTESIFSEASKDDEAAINIILSQMVNCSQTDSTKRPRIIEVEEKLKRVLSDFDESILADAIETLNRKIPLIVSTSVTEKITLQEKSETIFAKKLSIPFDGGFSEEIERKPLVSPSIHMAVPNIKATTSTSGGSFRDLAEARLKQAPEKAHQEVEAHLKATCSAVNHLTVIDVTDSAIELRRGDRIMINCKSRVLFCRIENSYMREDYSQTVPEQETTFAPK